MTQSNPVALRNCAMALLSAVLLAGTARLQTLEEEFRVYTEHPRLFLKPRRLRLLRRETERQSLRWRQFEMMMARKVRMPEPGFASALFYQATGQLAHCRQAIEWALGRADDLRQLAVVYDWCQPALTETQSRTLQAKLARGIEQAAKSTRVSAARDRVLAAVALAGHLPDVSEEHLRQTVQKWWRGETAPKLKSGRDAVPREDTYALFEILHAIRDNLYIDLRQKAPGFFKELPRYHLLSYYPSPYPAPENEYRIPAARGGVPDLRRAVLSRAAELSMVAYDPNTQENQFLQGWLIHDLFLMRSPFGIPYEFLWANPYLPGLSYYHMPLAYHDEAFGRLFLRSSWDEDATWLGYFDGELQLFENSQPKIVRPQAIPEPIYLSDAAVVFAQRPFHFTIDNPETKLIFMVGLEPSRRYEVEVDDEEMREEKTDDGGILSFTISPRPGLGVRIRPAPTRPPAEQPVAKLPDVGRQTKASARH